jgi:alanyl-tRNA synthetase
MLTKSSPISKQKSASGGQYFSGMFLILSFSHRQIVVVFTPNFSADCNCEQLASNQGDDLVNQAQGVNGVSVLASVVEGVNGKDLRDIVDKLKDKLGSAVIVLAAVSGNKVSLVAGVTKDLTDKYQAGKILNHVAQQVGGKGGGRPDMAQGGGTESSKVDEALASVKGLI